MNPPIVIIGIGELAVVFARAFLRNGYPVYPITRNMNIEAEAKNIDNPTVISVWFEKKKGLDYNVLPINLIPSASPLPF